MNLICKDFEVKYSAILSNDNHKILVASNHGKIIGFSKITKNEDDSFLDKLYVLRKYQGHDYGNLLLLYCMKAALYEFHSKQMSLEVWDGNVKAIKYYEKNQFHHTSKVHTKKTATAAFTGHEMICSDIAYDYQII